MLFLDLPFSYHVTKKTGEVLRVMDRGRTSIVSVLDLLLFNFLPSCLDLAVVVVYFFLYLNWVFTVIVLVTGVLYIAWTIVVTQWRVKFRRYMLDKDNFANDKACDSLINVDTVRFFGAQNKEKARYASLLDDYNAAAIRAQGGNFVLATGQRLLLGAGVFCAMFFAARDVTQGSLSVPQFVLVMSYVTQLYTPFGDLGNNYRKLNQAFLDMENMWDILSVPADKDADPSERASRGEPSAVAASPLLSASASASASLSTSWMYPALKVQGGSVEFKGVHFRYGPEDRLALEGISFFVPAGSTCAIVGDSGSGKSTITKLLFRFYDPTSGSISIDGQDITTVSRSSVCSAIGIVPQDTVLFNDTVAYNIEYGALGASRAEVEAAARAAHIHDMIERMPNGYMTRVGERGLRLSGGEKQRVSIARTILKNPRVLILDESTASLDTRTEREIQASLDVVCQGRTTIVIAHRLSTIVNADQILVMSRGVILERGTHAELLANPKGRFYAMWQAHLKSETAQAKGVQGQLSSSSIEERHPPVAVDEGAAQVDLAMEEKRSYRARNPLPSRSGTSSESSSLGASSEGAEGADDDGGNEASPPAAKRSSKKKKHPSEPVEMDELKVSLLGNKEF